MTHYPLLASLAQPLASLDLAASEISPALRQALTSLRPSTVRKPHLVVSVIERGDVTIVPPHTSPIAQPHLLSAPRSVSATGLLPATTLTLSNGHRWIVLEEPPPLERAQSFWISTRLHPRGGRDDFFAVGNSAQSLVGVHANVSFCEPSGMRRSVNFYPACTSSFIGSRAYLDYATSTTLTSGRQSYRDNEGDRTSRRVSDFSTQSFNTLHWMTALPTPVIEIGTPVSFQYPFTRVFRVGQGAVISNGEISLPEERPTREEWAQSSHARSVAWAKVITTKEWARWLNILTGRYADEVFGPGLVTEEKARAALTSKLLRENSPSNRSS